jgi:hypothetical protein
VNVYVGDLYRNLPQADLQHHQGQVPGRVPWFGFVEMPNKDEAEKARRP